MDEHIAGLESRLDLLEEKLRFTHSRKLFDFLLILNDSPIENNYVYISQNLDSDTKLLQGVSKKSLQLENIR